MSIRKCFIAMLVAASAAGAHLSGFAQQSSSPSLTQRLGDLLSSSKEDELIEPDLAFTVNLTVASPRLLVAELTPARGYYLYKDKIRFVLKDAKGVAIKSVVLPKGTPRKDPTFGTTETYTKPIRAEIALDRAPGARSVTLAASYQGCHEKSGVCYPPMNKELVVALP